MRSKIACRLWKLLFVAFQISVVPFAYATSDERCPRYRDLVYGTSADVKSRPSLSSRQSFYGAKVMDTLGQQLTHVTMIFVTALPNICFVAVAGLVPRVCETGRENEWNMPDCHFPNYWGVAPICTARASFHALGTPSNPWIQEFV